MIGIYGSDGFIGRHLVRRLASQGTAVRAVSRRHDEHFASSVGGEVQFVEADFTDSLAMAASLQDVDTVVQLISTSSPGLRNDHAVADIEENVVPHVAFLRDCVQAGVRRYVFLSSGGTVYGPGVDTPTPETAHTHPICSHGLTKLTVEKYIQMHGYLDGLQFVILRIANPFGPGQQFRKGQGLIPAVLDRCRRGQPVRIYGRGEDRRDYIYIDDVIDAITASLALEHGQLVMNIGSGETRSVVEVVDAIESVTGQPIAREFVPARNTDVGISCLDIAKAVSVLDWRPRVPFRQGIEETVRAAMADQRSRP